MKIRVRYKREHGMIWTMIESDDGACFYDGRWLWQLGYRSRTIGAAESLCKELSIKNGYEVCPTEHADVQPERLDVNPIPSRRYPGLFCAGYSARVSQVPNPPRKGRRRGTGCQGGRKR